MHNTQIAPLLCSSRLRVDRPLGPPSGRVKQRLLAAGLGLMLLSTLACSRVPELENRLSEDLMSQPYPTLLPLEQTPPAPRAPAAEAQTMADTLEARAARLRRRADALRAQDI